jgi:hypothetical protein
LSQWSSSPTPSIRTLSAADATELTRLEELDDVARGILEEDLRAARPLHDLVAKRHAGGAEPLDLGGEVVDE